MKFLPALLLACVLAGCGEGTSGTPGDKPAQVPVVVAAPPGVSGVVTPSSIWNTPATECNEYFSWTLGWRIATRSLVPS